MVIGDQVKRMVISKMDGDMIREKVWHIYLSIKKERKYQRSQYDESRVFYILIKIFYIINLPFYVLI